ncbi:MAG: restriction endonuclease [Pseudomonadota bacterium]
MYSYRDIEVWQALMVSAGDNFTNSGALNGLSIGSPPISKIDGKYVDCGYCGTPLTRIEDQVIQSLPENTECPLLWCENCGWWLAKPVLKGKGGFIGYAVRGICRRYDITSTEIPLKELRTWLSQHPEDSARVDPFYFEEVIADAFQHLLPDCKVLHIGGRRDKGIDLKIVENESSQILVQIKRRSDINGVESVSVVRELNGVLLREGVPKGIIVTTSKRYSTDAIQETQISRGSFSAFYEQYRMELMAFDDVAELLRIRPSSNIQPWSDVCRGVQAGGISYVSDLEKSFEH